MADNRRVRMTKKLIKDAYLELLESNPSEKISVTDVCKVADVNRSTFYMYYEDTIALRHDIENDVMDQIPVLSDMPSEITTDKQFVDILERFFSYIEENSRMFRILILQSDNRAFNRRRCWKSTASCPEPTANGSPSMSMSLSSAALSDCSAHG